MSHGIERGGEHVWHQLIPVLKPKGLLMAFQVQLINSLSSDHTSVSSILSDIMALLEMKFYTRIMNHLFNCRRKKSLCRSIVLGLIPLTVLKARPDLLECYFSCQIPPLYISIAIVQ